MGQDSPHFAAHSDKPKPWLTAFKIHASTICNPKVCASVCRPWLGFIWRPLKYLKATADKRAVRRLTQPSYWCRRQVRAARPLKVIARAEPWTPPQSCPLQAQAYNLLVTRHVLVCKLASSARITPATDSQIAALRQATTTLTRSRAGRQDG